MRSFCGTAICQNILKGCQLFISITKLIAFCGVLACQRKYK
jgi:hypothetical protein